MASQPEAAFGFFRRLFWPIYRSETKRALSLLTLLFLLCSCYSILRNLKDTLILTAPQSGAQVLPFLKVWGMLPAAFVATWAYTRLCRIFARSTIFYLAVGGFLSYFLLFALLLYPHRESLYLVRFSDWLAMHLPAGFGGLIALIRNWIFTSFYIISELWAVIVMTVLFWGYANEGTGVNEGKRLYGILNVGSTAAPLIGGALAVLFGGKLHFHWLLSVADEWHRTLIQLTLLVTVFGVLAMGLFFCMTRGQRREVVGEGDAAPVRVQLSIRESLRTICQSRYLIALALIVLSYNVTVNLADILWKEQLKRFFVHPGDMLNHLNRVTMGIGAGALLLGFLFSPMIHRLGWMTTALITPLMMAIPGLGFFYALFSADQGIAMLALPATATTVYLGSLQNCLSKAGKYSIFDASKELAFLPLPQEERLKGKAAIDGLGAGVGKSAASLTYQGLLLGLGSIASCSPYIATVLSATFLVWVFAVRGVGRTFKEITKNREEVLVREIVPQEGDGAQEA